MEIVRHTGLAKEHRASTYGFTAVGGVWSDGYWKKRGTPWEGRWRIAFMICFQWVQEKVRLNSIN